MEKHRIKFWGVRGSFPTPDRDKIEVGGHSSCVEVRTANNELIVFDMGTGFIPFGKSSSSSSVFSSIFLLKIKSSKPEDRFFELLLNPSLNLSKILIIKY